MSPNPARLDVEGKFSTSPLEISRERISESAQPRLTAPSNPARGEVEGKFSTSQALENPRNAKGISQSAPPERASRPARPYPIDIRLALPPAAVVLTQSERSQSRKSSGA